MLCSIKLLFFMMHSVLSLSLAMHIHRCFHNWDGVHAWMDCLSNVASTTLWGPRSCSGCHPGAGLRHWHCNYRGTNHRRNMRSIYISSFILRKWIWVAKDFFSPSLSYIKLDFLIFIFPLQFVQCKLQVLINEYVNSTTEERGLGSLIFFMWDLR